MLGLLIAVGDIYCRKQIAELFIEAGYNVIVTNSAANALYGILKNTAQVVLVGSGFDGLTAADLIPLIKRCNRKISIILVADNPAPALIRKLRREGIFYHALKPVSREDGAEIRQAVQCAFQRLYKPPSLVTNVTRGNLENKQDQQIRKQKRRTL